MFVSSNSKIIYVIVALLLIYGCAKENPDLVNPQPVSESVKIRFINLAGDFNPRALHFAEGFTTETIDFGETTTAEHPPADSTFLSVLNNNIREFELSNPIRFIRESHYTVFAVPTPSDSAQAKAIDTLIVQRTFAIQQTNNQNLAFLRMFNANPDEKVTYFIRKGCPNGDVLINPIRFKQVMNQTIQLPAGSNPISLIKRIENEDFILDLYDLKLEALIQHTLIVVPDENGGENLVLLNEQDETINALQPLDLIPFRTTQIRPINLSSENISVELASGSIIETDVVPNQIGSYKTIDACLSEEPDLIQSKSGNTVLSEAESSLNVMSKYTSITYDTETQTAGGTLLVEPLYTEQPIGNNSVVRVINASYNNQSINLLTGARSDPNVQNMNFSSSQYLAEKLNFGNIASYKFTQAGKIPLLLFSNTSPQKLLFSALIELEAAKSYVIVILNSSDNKIRISVIEDETENSTTYYQEEGVFLQVVNAVGGKSHINVNFIDLLNNASLFGTGSLATVVMPGSYNIELNGVNHNFEATLGERILIVASGYENQTKIYFYSNKPLGATLSNYARRFINLSDIELIAIKDKDNPENPNASPTPIIARVGNGLTTPTEFITKAGKTQFMFYNDDELENNPKSEKYLLKITDIPFNFGKNYSIIFAGVNEKKYYIAIVQQEY